MKPKEMKFKEEAHKKILQGVRKLAQAVEVTLGPRGRVVMIEQEYGAPRITKDGVSVAKEIKLKDAHENLGAQMVKNVAASVGNNAGDGTTTATTITKVMYEQGSRLVAAGVNPMDISKGMQVAASAVEQALKTSSRPVKDSTEIAQVATISANGEKAIGDIIAQAMSKVGKEGVITVEEANGLDTTLEVVEGMQFTDRGYLSSYFATNPETLVVEYRDPCILVHEKKISSVKPFLPLLQAASEAGKPLLIVAEDVEGEALATLVVNRIRGGLKVCAVKAPGFGDRRKDMLKDLAILTGTEVVSDETGKQLKDVAIEDLGTAKRIVVDKDSTTIVNGGGANQLLKAVQVSLESR